MSLASSYASQIATQTAALNSTQMGAPIPWSGPQGLSASVTNSGDCLLSFGQATYTVPAVILVAFSQWITTTFV